jgi:ribosomal protein S18 acetylase RimI-like enzyme
VNPELRRAVAFEEALRERCAERIVPFRFGRAIFDDTFRSVWDLNVLRVDEPRGATAEALAAEAERLQGGAGHQHRRVAVGDDEVGARLEAGFHGLGWESDRFVFMAWRGPGERGAGAAVVEEVDGDAQRPLRERVAALEPWADSEETVRMVLGSSRRVSQAGDARHFAVREDGEVVSAADLYSDGSTAQVEDVVTSPEHRGRGYASAVVLHAVEEALAGGHDFVFLVADDGDWPKELYARLGFVPIGRKWTFLKRPAPARRA